MTREEARHILAAWSGAPETVDPDVAEAQALSRGDPQLATWLARQQAFQAAAAGALRAILPPGDLVERIVAARKVRRVHFGAPAARGLAIAAILLVSCIGAWVAFGPHDSGDGDFATFRSRMVRSTLREYRMDVVTNDLAAIRGFMASHAAPADFELTPPLARVTPVGGGILRWQGHFVSMICLDGGPRGMLYLFVVPTPTVAHGAPAAAEAARVNRLATVSWSRGERTYVLAADTNLEDLRRFL